MLQQGQSLYSKVNVVELPLSFMQSSMLDLSKINTSIELDTYLDRLFEQDWCIFVDQHAKMLLVFSMILSAEIRRIVFRNTSIVFPHKLLLLPPLYHRLGWTFQNNGEWDQAHRYALQYYTKKPNVSDAILLLYLEGMKSNLTHAVFLYQQRLQDLRINEEEYLAAASLLNELAYYGWPTKNEDNSASIH